MPERQSTDDNNPFAPPPEGRPDQPWQPRRPEGSDDEASGAPDSSGPSDGRWSPRQPGPSNDGFGRGPERQGGQGGPDGPDGGNNQGGNDQGGNGRQGLRWDPKDPAQRRARYAILAGMWAFFFAIFEIPELALLLGALGLYWAISSLRTKPKPATELSPTSQPESAPTSQPSGRPSGRPSGQGATATPLRSMRTAAISGLVAASVALMIVAMGFTMRLVYSDFYECRDDALTHAGQLACNDLLPKPLRAGFGVRE
ncbi:hypothetical protein [Streptomyces sp. NPDC058664]|uniref:hypothetical protein n=1 Tax=unclassified Streptomyces TaxID=2593676 RepID=UPI00364CFDC7